MAFVEAFRQFQFKVDPTSFFLCHVSLVCSAGELYGDVVVNNVELELDHRGRVTVLVSVRAYNPSLLAYSHVRTGAYPGR